MAKRFTYTTKWDDDWYLGLPPRLKLAWNYLCDNCDGIGFLKLSLSLMSFRIGEQVTKEEFAAAFEGRIHWVSDDTIWLIGYIKAQYKNLSANNKAHVNMAAKVIKNLEGQELSLKAQAALDPLLTLLRPSIDPQPTVDGPSGEGSPRDIGNRIQDKGNRKSIPEEGCGEKPFALSAKAIEAGLEQVYKCYPRKEGKSPGMRTLKSKIKTAQELLELETAVTNYTAHCKRKGREGEFVLMWSTFANQWSDWLDPTHGSAEDFSEKPISIHDIQLPDLGG